MSNCLIFAIALFLRRFQHGRRQYISIRKADPGWFPHFGYIEERRGKLRHVSYKPIEPKEGPLWMQILFRGEVRWGDEPGPKGDH